MMFKIIRPIGFQDIVVVVAIAALILVQLPGFANDPGIGWHLATGQFIFQRAEIPLEDPFLHSESVRSWVSDQWLSDLVFFITYAFGSWPALYGLICIVFCIGFFGLLYPAVRKTSGSALAAGLTVMFAFKVAQVHFILRPVVFGIFCFILLACLIWRLLNHWRAEDNSASDQYFNRLALGLPVLFILWSNLHPSFVLGLILLALLPLGLLIERALFAAGKDHFGLVLAKVLMLFGLCWLASLVNPYGARLHTSILALGQSEYFMQLHQEWRSPDFGGFEGYLFQFGLVSLALLAFAVRGVGIKLHAFEVLALILFSGLAMRSVRCLPYWGIVVSFPLALLLRNLGGLPVLNVDSFVGRFRQCFSMLEQREARSYLGWPSLCIFLIVIGWGSFSKDAVPLYAGEYGPDRASYPYEAVDFINQLDSSKVVLASPDWGGFITWFGQGRVKAVIDDRNTLIGEKFYREFIHRLKPEEDWFGFAKEIGADYIMLRRGSPLDKWIRREGDLFMAFEDDIATVFDLESHGVTRP